MHGRFDNCRNCMMAKTHAITKICTARNTLIHQKYMTEKIYNNCNNVLLILNFYHLSSEPFQNITLDEKWFQYG